MSGARPIVVPAFLPTLPERPVLIDPPARLPVALDDHLAALAERIAAGLAARRKERPAGSEPSRVQVGLFGGSIGRLPSGVRAAVLSAAHAAMRRQRADDAGPDACEESLRVTLEPEDVTPELLVELHEAGVRTVELDAGTFDDEPLLVCGLPHRSADLPRAVEAIRAAGLEAGIVLRPGMPGSAADEPLRSARRAAELRPSFVRILPVLVLAGTALARAFASRRYRPLALEEAVPLCTDLLRLFEEAGVPVCRLGLQPAVDLDGGARVIAGPHHPALRALAEAALWLERAQREMAACFRFQKEMTLVVHPRDESRMRGPQGVNVRRLREKFRLAKLTVRVDASLGSGELQVEALENPASTGRRAG